MGVLIDIMTYTQMGEVLAATGTFDSVAAAIESGVVTVVGEQAVGGFAVIEGGAAAKVISLTDTALEIAQSAELAATAAKVETGAVTVAETAAGAKLMGLMTLDLGVAAAAAAPLAGVALGAGLYESNPSLWTKISETLLPFCYAENKVQAFLDYVVDSATGQRKPVVLLAKAIVDALKQLFEEEVELTETYKATDTLGRTIVGTDGGPIAAKIMQDLYCGDWTVVSSCPYYPARDIYEGYFDGFTTVRRESDGTVKSETGAVRHFEEIGGGNPYTLAEIGNILTEPDVEKQEFPPTAGVSAPTVPVEPEVWPDTPIIVIPDPLGPDYQPIPVTPVTPLPLPAPEPVPLLPEYVPDPTPDKPEEWPEEEPWPTTIPFPVQPTEPDPEWPEVMPWPLPAEPPQEWPTHPEPWEWPEELPWPRTPEEWPDSVPWPDSPPDPEEWPDGEPWPETPEEWPETVPWPVPWPENWPETEPWPIKWPDELPYPWPFPYPYPSEDPYPDPKELENPEKQVDPYIDPWPYQFPDPFPSPKTDPDPYQDPSNPEPQPEPQPDPEPQPQPTDPYPTPPTGDLDPPIIPLIPLPFSSTTGLISVYHPTQSELLAFAQWLWVTWQDATIEKIWNNPFDGVITLFELYCTPTDVGRKNIRSGFLDSGVSSETISRYTEIDCGSIGVPEYYGNYFDYSPYSKCHVFLPFIGIVELNVDDIVGHGVNITYRIDEYNGSCIAMITCAKSTVVNGEEVDYSAIIYQFSGNCAVELPIAGGSQAAIKAGMLEAAAWGLGSVISGVITGGTGGGLGIGASIGNNLAQGVASAVHSVVSAKSSVQHSGSFGSSYGAMGGKKPYLIVTRPKQIQVPNYNELYGYQAHKMVRVGDCTGYLRCREVHVISPTASDDEKALIEQLMKTGVYVTE